MRTGPYTAVRSVHAPGGEGGEPERGELSIGQGDAHDAAAAESPGSVAVTRGRSREGGPHAPPPQFRIPPSPGPPLSPQGAAKPPVDPRVQQTQHRRGLTEAEVFAPPLQVARELLHPLFQADPARPSRR